MERAIDPETVRAALDADVRGIVEKQEAGKTLTATERKTLESWLASQVVDEEPEEEAAVEFALDPGPVVELRTQQDVADAYGYSIRQVKNWIREGRKAGKPCPYERPEEMPAWFEVVFAPRECPERLRSAVQCLLEGAREPASSAKPAGPRVVTEEDLVDEEVGFEATLKRALRREAVLDLRLRKAIEEGDPRADALETQWGKAAARVRELEKAAPAILEAQGVYVRRADVKTALLEIAGVIPKGILSELKRRWQALRACESIEEFEAEASEGLAAALRELCESRFADPLELEVAS